MTTAKVLLLGATGGIGSQALIKLLKRGVNVTVIVRSETCLPNKAKDHQHLSVLVLEAGALGMGVEEMAELVQGCDAVISCLGHNPTLSGIFGHPRTLCVDTTKLVCNTIKAVQPEKPIKYIVVNTVGVDHPDGKTDPPRGLLEQVILWLLEKLVSAMSDNVKTSDYMYKQAASNKHMEFCVVRPDSLIDCKRRNTTTNGEESGRSSDSFMEQKPVYTVHESLQNGLFNAGISTRANVGHFMADLVTEVLVWELWKGKFPQILDVTKDHVKHE